MPGDTIGVGVIGTGFGGAVQIPAFHNFPGARVVAVCSGRQERANEFASKFDIPFATTDYRELVQRPDVDLVSITPPPYLHHEMTLAALAAGKHVLCEKPTAMNLAEARDMAARAKAAGVVHMIDHEFRFIPARARMKELLEEGYLGQPTHISLSALGGARGDFVTARPWNWWSRKDQGGGHLQAIGSHLIDAVRWWFGEFGAVSADLPVLTPLRTDPATGEQKPVDADEGFHIVFRLQNGAPGVLLGSSAARFGPGNRIEAYGTEGTLVITADNQLLGGRKGGQGLEPIEIPNRLQVSPIAGDIRVGWVTRIIERMTAAIREGQTDVAPNLADGVQVQEVMDAVRRSSEQRTWVSLPLAE